MKLKLFLFLIPTLSFSQDLLEKDYSINGRQVVATTTCLGQPFIRVSMQDGPFEKSKHSYIELTPYKENVVGFKTLSKPVNFIAEEGFNGKRYSWVPLKDYKETESIFIEVIPIYKESMKDSITQAGKCLSYKIFLPLVKNIIPEVINNDQIIPIAINGSPIKREFNLIGGSVGDNYQTFKDDDPNSMVLAWNARPSKFDISTDKGVITFRHNGPLPEAVEERTLVAKLNATDNLGQSSGEAKLTFNLVRDDLNSTIVFNLADATNTIDTKMVWTEGKENAFKPLIARSLSDNRKLEIETQSIIPGKHSIENESFIWTPSFDMLEDFYGESPQERSWIFKAANGGGVFGLCTLKFRVKNATTPVDLEKYNKAIANFESMEKEFINVVEDPLCYIRYASNLSTRNDTQISSINEITSGLSSISAVSGNPVALAVAAGIGELTDVLAKVGTNRAEKIKEQAQKLNKEIEVYKNQSIAFIQFKDELGEFMTSAQCDKLLELSTKLVTNINALKVNISDYTAITAFFGRRAEGRIKGSCQ